MNLKGSPRSLLTLLLIPVLLVATPVLAQRFGDGPDRDAHGDKMEMMFDLLDLTPLQREQLQQVHADLRESTSDLRQQAQDAHEVLQGLIDAPEVDETAIRDTAATLGVVQAELAIARARMRQELSRFLSPEQLDKMETLKKMRGHGPSARGRGKDRGPSAPAAS